RHLAVVQCRQRAGPLQTAAACAAVDAGAGQRPRAAPGPAIAGRHGGSGLAQRGRAWRESAARTHMNRTSSHDPAGAPPGGRGPAAEDARPQFGAHVQADGTTRFRLWAPSAPATLALEVEGFAPIALRPDADGWVQADVACAPGARYRYRLDAGRTIPDPAS